MTNKFTENFLCFFFRNNKLKKKTFLDPKKYFFSTSTSLFEFSFFKKDAKILRLKIALKTRYCSKIQNMLWKNCCFELAQNESAKNALLRRLVAYFDNKIFLGDKNIQKKQILRKKILQCFGLKNVLQCFGLKNWISKGLIMHF